MIDWRFWGLIGLLSLVMLIATLLQPLAERLIKRPMNRAVLAFASDRVRNGWTFLFAAWAAVALHPAIALILFAGISFLGLREFLTRTPANAADYRALFVAFFVLIPLQYAVVGWGRYAVFSVLIPVYAFFLLPSLSALANDTKEFFARAAKLQLGVMLAVYCISHIPATLTLTIKGWDRWDNHPAYLLLFCALVTQTADVVQYAVSRTIGKRRVARTVVRHLTLEGMGAGLLAAMLIGLSLYWYVPFNLITTVGVAAATAGMGFLGALVLGGIKRSTGAQDWGEATDGRSSTLDRLASMCFAAPVFYHLTRAFTNAV
jgi:phosphatidate cytidylyltransferase